MERNTEPWRCARAVRRSIKATPKAAAAAASLPLCTKGWGERMREKQGCGKWVVSMW